MNGLSQLFQFGVQHQSSLGVHQALSTLRLLNLHMLIKLIIKIDFKCQSSGGLAFLRH